MDIDKNIFFILSILIIENTKKRIKCIVFYQTNKSQAIRAFWHALSGRNVIFDKIRNEYPHQ